MIIYQTMRNADMTEGRGPMVPDEAFFELTDAESYIDSKYGVMGRKAKWSEVENGEWQVKEVRVHANLADCHAAKLLARREIALRKLTPADRKALDIKD